MSSKSIISQDFKRNERFIWDSSCKVRKNKPASKAATAKATAPKLEKVAKPVKKKALKLKMT